MDLKRIYDEANQTSHDSGLQAIFAAGVDEGRRQVMEKDSSTEGEESHAQTGAEVQVDQEQQQAKHDYEVGDKKPWPGDGVAA